MPAIPPLHQLDPAAAWQPWRPDDRQPWDLKWAGHLFRRTAFGASPGQLREAVERGFQATFDQLLVGNPDLDHGLRTRGEMIARRNDPFLLRSWWLSLMLRGAYPLREKLALFWHNHFATSLVKVQSTLLMHRQNELIRRHALGKFEPFLLEISQDPAMLVWLDSNSNVKGKPNENYAREVMELFSLGVGHYTEKDVREAARAFTGWHTADNAFAFQAHLHDYEPKTVLDQTGNWDGSDIVRIVLEQPAAPRFLVRKLYRAFVSEFAEPPDALLEPLAERFRQSGYDIAALMRMMLGSRHFFSAHAYRQRVKCPVEFALDAVQAIGQGLVTPGAVVRRLQAMGQELFAPPNVKGWVGGRTWLNTATVLARHNFAQALTLGMAELNLEDADPRGAVAVALDVTTPLRRQKITEPERVVAFFADALLQGDLRDSARRRLVVFLQEEDRASYTWDQRVREMVHALMTMSEYQLA